MPPKTRGGGNVRRSKRQAGLGVSPVVPIKVPKRSKTKELVKVYVDLDSEETIRGGREQSDVIPVVDDIPKEVDPKMTESAMSAEGEKEHDSKIDEVEEDEEELHVESDKDPAGVDAQVDPEDKESEDSSQRVVGEESSQPAAGEETSQPATVREETPQTAEEVETENASTGGGEEPSQPADEVQTQQSNSTTKRTRGLTKMRKVAKDPLAKVEVEFTSLGEHAGSGSVTLSSFLGPLVREHVPVLLDDWRKLDDQTKDTLWEEIQV